LALFNIFASAGLINMSKLLQCGKDNLETFDRNIQKKKDPDLESLASCFQYLHISLLHLPLIRGYLPLQ
jgi:hypothetical protein